MKLLSPFLTLLFLMVACGCEKNRNRNFPQSSFEEYVYLNNPSSYDLRTTGGSIYHNGGYRGLIVYRRYANNGPNDFGVYDRGCPEHYSRDCGQLEISNDGTFAVCPCEDEEYLLIDGSPAEGANISLVEYQNNFDGSVIYINNL